MKRKILLIEDNIQNRYMMTFLLEKHGYEVVPAEDGVAGIELATRIKPCIILLDIQLPKMDGYEVARELRRNPALKGIPIVAVTSYAMMSDRDKALKAGCDGYLEKPINPETFVTDIEKLMSVPMEGAIHETNTDC